MLLVGAAALTAFYSCRLIFLTFHGRPRAPAEVMEHAHESPPVMLWPLYPLAAGSLLAGYLFYPVFVGGGYEAFWRESLFEAPGNVIRQAIYELPTWVPVAPVIAMALGVLVAVWFYLFRPEAPVRLAARHDALYRFLLNKWYFDELFDRTLVRPAMALGTFLWRRGDGWLIDGFGPDGVSARVFDVTRRVVKLQSGYLYHYAFAMLIGLSLLVTWIMFAG
jgi:NADH-quinone oxidoreductase subunit L